MPEADLSAVVPPAARWVKIRYTLRPKAEGANLIARVWSDVTNKEAMVLKGESGEAFVRLKIPQKLFYQNPVNVEMKLKVIAFKQAEDAAPDFPTEEK